MVLFSGTLAVAADAPPVNAGQAPPVNELIIPDVCGHVCRAATVPATPGGDLREAPAGERAIEVYPNWPQAVAGSNWRGGVCAQLDGDADLEILYPTSNRIHAWNIDGTPVAGWPQTLVGYHDGAPAVGDVDGDGLDEIVVSTRIGSGSTGMLHVFEVDGSPLAPFPISLNGGATKTPALGNIDDDPALEIVVEERAYPIGYVTAYNGDGTTCPGWPQELDYVPGSAASVGDVTGDGRPEIVGQSYYYVYAWDAAGQLLPGFPFAPGAGRVFSYSSCVLADLDGDGRREILCGDHSVGAGNGRVHVLRSDGTQLPGWPRTTVYWIYGPPSVGDIDGDGNPDVAVGDQVLSGYPANYLYAWDATGNPLPGFPVGPTWAINSQILLADLDGDDQVELMTDDNTGYARYMAYNHDGTPVDGWPLPVQGTSFFINPLAIDVNGDGELDLSGGGYDSNVETAYFFLWDANVPVNDARNHLTMLQYNPQHDGVYVGRDPAAVPEAGLRTGSLRLLATPNPFGDRVALQLAGPGDVADDAVPAGLTTEVSVYAADGRRVRNWTRRLGDGGPILWNGCDGSGRPVPNGLYLCVAQAGDARASRRIVLTR